MKHEERHRHWITAVAQGDTETAQTLHAGAGAYGDMTAGMYLRGVTTVCLHHRLGAPNGGGGIDHETIARLVADMRVARRNRCLTVPIPGFLYVEGAIRALYGESHLFAELGPTTTDAALTAVLRYLYSAEPGVRTRFKQVIVEAQQMMTDWMLG